MSHLFILLLAATTTSAPSMTGQKTLANSVSKDNSFERLQGKSQFRLGCRYLVRCDDRTTVFRPSVLQGPTIALSYADITYRVEAANKALLPGSDGAK